MPVPMRWPGETVAVIAPGPSLTREDAAATRGKARVIAIGDAWRLAPHADILYHADAPWWEHHRGAPAFRGEKWIAMRADPKWSDRARWQCAAARYGLRPVATRQAEGMSFDPAVIHEGWHSGHQALNIAALAGGRVLLLGFDYQVINGRRHFFGDHPGTLNQQSDYALFARVLASAAPQLAAAGIEVINCSRGTALTCFPRMRLNEALG